MTTFHNDAFLPIVGSKAAAIGIPFDKVCAEARDDIGQSPGELSLARALILYRFLRHSPLLKPTRGTGHVFHSLQLADLSVQPRPLSSIFACGLND
jgi:hypothetical protein